MDMAVMIRIIIVIILGGAVTLVRKSNECSNFIKYIYEYRRFETMKCFSLKNKEVCSATVIVFFNEIRFSGKNMLQTLSVTRKYQLNNMSHMLK